MSYSIEKADLALNSQCLLELLQRNFDGISSDRFDWMYEKNPDGPAIVFLLKHEQTNTVVGAMALFPHFYIMNGQQIKGYICGDMAVDQAHRMLGPAMALIKAAVKYCDKNPACVLLSLPNTKSLPVLQRAGFQSLGIYFSLTKVLKTGNYLRRYFGSNVIADGLAFVVDRCVAQVYKLESIWFAKGYEIDLIKEPDNDIDVFNAKSASYQPWFAGLRTSAFLKWRLVNSPYGKNEMFVLKRNNRMSGYISFCVRSKRCQIEDFAFDGKLKTLMALLAAFTSYQIKKDVEALSVRISGNEALIDALKKSRFHIREHDSQFMFYAAPETLLQQLRSPSDIWYLTAADNDV